MPAITVGSVVRCRNREWVVLPSSNDDIYLLRPLSGLDDEITGIHKQLADRNLDPVEPSEFPLPDPAKAGDAAGTALLFNAARLLLRDNAGPFRSLGRIGVRPRPYQFVPLLMALRLDPVRLLISDDVGIGKTIEALLIARELLDRREIRRTCIVCPPCLCDQWKQEMQDRFRIEAEIIRAGTINQLERRLPSVRENIFGYFPHIIVSIDFVKSDAHRAQFLHHAPEFVIVDEAHGAVSHGGASAREQQRHRLLRGLSENPDRHIVLLTATPHSGVESGFSSLLGLISPEFESWDITRLTEAQRKKLAAHFVQRRRADVSLWMGEQTPFPKRVEQEVTFDLSARYARLFRGVYDFSRQIVRNGEGLSEHRRRIRYWTALALLRCVMSSPASAIAAIENRLGRGTAPEEDVPDSEYSPYIFETAEEENVDVQPAHIVEEGENECDDAERRELRRFSALAAEIQNAGDDKKMAECSRVVAELLESGFRPIVWCRYIATSNYVAEQLRKRLASRFPNLEIASLTGAISDDERRERIRSFDQQNPHRVLCATDCLSEGINLQEQFNAVLHYDLPWNPNRLEQREGRVDRFGQASREVRTVLLYGRDNPVDGAVLDVLLRKARQIFNALGVRVPVPIESESVMAAVVRRLFAESEGQLDLFAIPEVQDALLQWERNANSEKISLTRFAQRAIKPDEVERQLSECDPVLTKPELTKQFFETAIISLGLRLRAQGQDTWSMSGLDALPEQLRGYAPKAATWKIGFQTPAVNGATAFDRNHPFIGALAEWLVEGAIAGKQDSRAVRSGVIRTDAISARTVLLLCRLRYSITVPDRSDLLAEEVRCFGFRGSLPRNINWLPDMEAESLLETARPSGNISPKEREETLSEVLRQWPALRAALEPLVTVRSRRLESAHRDVRESAKLRRRGTSVAKHFPPDLLGLAVLLPVPKGIR